MSRPGPFGNPHCLGFDDVERILERLAKTTPESYPPINIEEPAEGQLRVTLAVAGFAPEHLTVTLADRQLMIKGDGPPAGESHVYLHKGIAARGFQRTFILADGWEVEGARLSNGLLRIDIRKIRPTSQIRQISMARAGRLAAAVLAVVAAGLWGGWVMDRVSESFHLTSHWAEWFDADLVWATPSLTAVSLVEYVVFAPLFEELAFRGLLFAILRRKFSFLPAALISAGIFGIAHGYGWVGLLSVCWSGVLWAWIYEKTGSLLPGILAHAINNLLVCLAVMALLR